MYGLGNKLVINCKQINLKNQKKSKFIILVNWIEKKLKNCFKKR